MASKEREFWDACTYGHLTLVKSLSTQVDVNWANPDPLGRTGLHQACLKGREEIVQYLLTLPQIDVNRGDREGDPPLSYACVYERRAIFQMLANDGRVDLNKENQYGATPLWIACRWLREEAVDILLASGRKIDTTKRKKEGRDKVGTTAAEAATNRARPQFAALLEEYERNPKEVSQRLRQELNWPTPASTVFAQTIFFSDGLLALQPEDNGPAHRFFSIAARLPLDLQHLLANRSQGLAGDNVPAADRELAFTSLARSFQN